MSARPPRSTKEGWMRFDEQALLPATPARVWEASRRLAIDHVGVVVGVGEWRLDPTEDGTLFTWHERFRMPPPILGAVALLLYSPFQRLMLRRSIRNLTRLVEALPA